MARWKWHQAGDQDLLDPIGPATMYVTHSGEPDCESGPAWADETTCEFQITSDLKSELSSQAVSIPRTCVRIRADK